MSELEEKTSLYQFQNVPKLADRQHTVISKHRAYGQYLHLKHHYHKKNRLKLAKIKANKSGLNGSHCKTPASTVYLLVNPSDSFTCIIACKYNIF